MFVHAASNPNVSTAIMGATKVRAVGSNHRACLHGLQRLVTLVERWLLSTTCANAGVAAGRQPAILEVRGQADSGLEGAPNMTVNAGCCVDAHVS